MPGTENDQTAARPRYRVNAKRKVAVITQGDGGADRAESEAELVELSADGARLALATPLEFQEQILLALDEEFGLAEPLAAEVRWSRRARRGRFLVGCAFACHLPDDLLEELLADGVLDNNEPARRGVSGEADGWKELNPTALHVRLVDLSRGGLSVVSPQPAKIGQRLRLVFQDGDRGPVEIVGNIRWQGETQEGFLLGCQFEHDEYYFRIRDLVCPGAARGGNGKDRRAHKRTLARGRMGWLTRLWKQQEEDLVVSASLNDLLALTASLQGEFDPGASDAPATPLADQSSSCSVKAVHDDSDPVPQDTVPLAAPSADVVDAVAGPASPPIPEPDSGSTEDDYAVFERRFRELQSLAGQAIESSATSSSTQAEPDSQDGALPDVSSPQSEAPDQPAGKKGPDLSLDSEDAISPGAQKSQQAAEDSAAALDQGGHDDGSTTAPKVAPREKQGPDLSVDSEDAISPSTRETQPALEDSAVALDHGADDLSTAAPTIAPRENQGPNLSVDSEDAVWPTTQETQQAAEHSAVALDHGGDDDGATGAPTGARQSDESPGAESTEQKSLEILLSETAALRTRQEQLAAELQQSQERLAPPDASVAHRHQAAPATIKRIRRRRRRPLLRGLRLFVLMAIGAVCWSWYAPGPLSALLQVRDWRALIGPGFATPTVTEDDIYTVAENGTLTVQAPGVLGNDRGAAGRSHASVVRKPHHGTLQLNEDGSFQYNPAPGFHGIDHFDYQGADRAGADSVATVQITVTPINKAPVAIPDAYTVGEDQTLSIDEAGLLANDVGSEREPLGVVLASEPEHGIVSLNDDGTFQYTPQRDFHGTDRFTYKAVDSAAQSEAATVNITVEPINDTPLASPDEFSTVEDNPLRVSAPGVLSNDRDVEQSSLTAQTLIAPEHGTLTLSPDGSFQYEPHADFSGVDRFTYHVHDGSIAAEGVVTITVAGTNDAPSSAPIADVTNPDPAVPVTIDLSQVFEDADADPLSYTVQENTQPNWVAATISRLGSLELHFEAPAAGTAEIRVRATDPAGEFTEQTVRINGTAVARPVNPNGTKSTRIDDPRLAELAAAIELDPSSAESWKVRARRYRELGQWQHAADDLDEALMLDPSDRGAWVERGAAHAELGLWQAAQSDFAQAIAIGPDAQDTAYVTYLHALAALGAGDLDAYRRVCAQVVQRSATTSDGTGVIWTSWTCSLAPHATVEFRPLAEQISPVAEGNRRNVFATVALGALYYRGAQFEQALDQLARISDREAGSGPLPYDGFFLAMTYARLGRSAEAREWLRRASDAADALRSDGRKGVPLSWNQALTLQLLRREAETTIVGADRPSL